MSRSVLVPRLLPHPPQTDPGVRPDLDGGRLSCCDGLLDGLHEVLGVADQHLRGLDVLLRSLGAQHGRLHGGQNLELSSDGGNPLTDRQEILQGKYTVYCLIQNIPVNLLFSFSYQCTPWPAL